MKIHIKNFTALCALALVFSVNSCSIDNIKPINESVADETIRDESSAQAVLNGVYDLGRHFDLGSFPLYLVAYGNEGLITGASLSGGTGYNTNQVPIENSFLSNLYNSTYKIINNSNFLIRELEAGKAVGISDMRKAEMISEAKFQRALSYFSLLRYFGEFYDLNSSYGVVLRTDFSTVIESQPRNTVQEVYDLIKEDLNYAIEFGPVAVEHFYSGSLAAKALLAKVELYTGNYPQAAILADEVINNGEGYVLELNYSDIFTNSFESSEVIFAPFSGPGNEGGSQMELIKNTKFSEILRVLADSQVGTDSDGDLTEEGSNYDPRFAFAYASDTKGVNSQGKYPFQGINSRNNTLYHLRLAEIYLVHAEAEARRPGGDLNTALASLNIIRNRAGVDEKTIVDLPTFLEDVREEKLLELFFENGEPYFDIVRYHQLGDLNAATIKPNLSVQGRFILPIPSTVLIGNNNMIQNPNY